MGDLLDAALAALALRINRLNEAIGRAVAWVVMAMVLVQMTIVLMRYVFGIGSIMLQESVVYMHAILFMVAVGYTLLYDGHVRIDIIYREASPRYKALVDLAGVIVFLIPVCALIARVSWPYVAASWRVLEEIPGNQRHPGGVPVEKRDPGIYRPAGSPGLLAGRPFGGHPGRRQLARPAAGGRPAMIAAETFSLLHVRVGLRFLLAGFPVAFTLAGNALLFAGLGMLFCVSTPLPHRLSATHLRHHDQRGAARRAAVHFHGRDAGALQGGRGTAGHHGPRSSAACAAAWAFRSRWSAP